MPRLGDEEAAARIDAILGGGGGTAVAPGGGVQRFSDEEAAARIDMLLPRELNPAEWIAGGALGGAAKLAGLGKIATDKLNRAIGSDDESQFFGPLESGLKSMEESVYPEASRGQGGLAETLLVTGGQTVPTVVGGLPGRAAKLLTFGAQEGVPLYYEIKAKTGDEEAATWGLVAGMGIGQLEQFGAEKALSGIIKKVAGSAGLSKALAQESTKYMLGMGGLTEAGTGVVQTGLSDLVYETLSGDDIDNWENIKRSIPPSLILGEGFHVLDAAIKAGPSRQGPQGSGDDAALARGLGGPQDAPGAKQAAPAAPALVQPEAPLEALPEEVPVQAAQTPGPPVATAAIVPPVDVEPQPSEIPGELPAVAAQAPAPEAAQAEPVAPPPAETTPVQEPVKPYGKASSQTLPPGVLPNSPEWVRENIAADIAEADRLGISDRIEELSAERLTAQQVAIRLNEEQGLTGGSKERRRTSQLVRSVRAVRGIPSMDSKTEFEAWLIARGKTKAVQEPVAEFQRAGDVVDGRRVRDEVPNLGSISSSLTEYEELPGVRDVPMSAFTGLTGKHYSAQGTKRIEELADQIKASGEINPLIVVVDEKGPYILEGATRVEALYRLGAKSFPAVVVRDLSGSTPSAAKPAPAPEPPPPTEPTPQPEVAVEPTPDPAPEPQKTTSVKNAVVDRELAEMGLPPAQHGEKVTDLERHGKAMAALKSDPQSGSRLVDELAREPRAPSGDEGALLALEVNRLINERDSAQEAFNAEPTEANQARIDKAAKDYARAADVVTKSGTESSASLRIRKMMIARDYSLAAMERSFQAAKGGMPLTAEERTEISDLAAKLKASEKALEDYRKEVQPRLTELEGEVESLKKGKKARRQRSVLESKKRIDEILNRLGGGQKAAAGLDLEKVKLVGELAYESVKLGYNSFALWADDVVARAGERVRPHLKQAWDEANERHDTDRLGRYKSRKKGDIARVEAKGEAGVFEKPRKTPIEKDPEALKLKADYEAARRRFEGLKEKARLAHQTKGDKALGIAKEFLDFPRAVMSSFDVSAPGRQGAFFAFGHPIMALRQAKRMFHALGSPRKALEIDVALRERPTYALGEAAGLELTRHTDDLGATEETMRSRFAERIPGVKASNRAFTTFINLQRAHMFDRMVGAIPTDAPTLEQAKAVARFVNIATGRGDPGRLGSAVDAAGMVLWSPRLLLSRFQLLAPAHLRKGDWQTRKAVAKEYARSLAGIMAVYTAVGLADDLDDEDDIKVELDPRSSDFGKFRIGPVRIDPLAGLSQVSVLASRLVSGEKMSSAGKVTPIRGKVPYGGDTSTSVVARFLRSKFGPVAATAWDAVEGEDVIGRPVELGNAPKNLLVPLSFKDVFTSLRELGIPKTAALTLLSMFGVGVQNYDAAKKDTKP